MLGRLLNIFCYFGILYNLVLVLIPIFVLGLDKAETFVAWGFSLDLFLTLLVTLIVVVKLICKEKGWDAVGILVCFYLCMFAFLFIMLILALGYGLGRYNYT